MIIKQLKLIILTVERRFSKPVTIRILLFCLMALLCIAISPKFALTATVEPATINSQMLMNNSSNLVDRAETLSDSGQFSEAIQLLQQAVQIYRNQGDKLNEATALGDLSIVYQEIGQWARASKALADSFELLQTDGVRGSSRQQLQVLAQILNTQGNLQLAQGQTSQALITWQKAASTYSSAGDKTNYIRALINQTQALGELGSYYEALDILTGLLPKLIQQPDSSLKASGLLMLGKAERRVGDLEKSRQALQESLAVAQRLGSSQDIGLALLNLGDLARTQQNPQSALAFYQQAADTEPSVTIRAQLNQLALFIQNQQYDNASALLPQLQTESAKLLTSHDSIYTKIYLAENLIRLRLLSKTHSPPVREIYQLLSTSVQQAESLGDQRGLSFALGTLGALYEQTHQGAEARAFTQKALTIGQSINAPELGYRWQWQLGRLLKAQGNIPSAIAAYSSSVEDLKLLRENLVGINSDIQFSFREQVEPVYRQLVDLLLQSDHPSQSNLLQARETIESLQLAELDNFFRVACLENKPVELDKVVDNLDPTAAVIYPIILPNRLAVILKLPSQTELHYYETTIAQSQVEKVLDNLQEELFKPGSLEEVQIPSQQVYNWLLRPGVTDLVKSKVNTLVFVLDGDLRNIPMAALYDGKQYLIEKYAVALTPGLHLLAPKALKQAKLKTLTAGITKERFYFHALHNVGIELQEIKSELPTTELLNQQFTSAALQKQLNDSPYSIVHLATHGQFSSQPEETFILAWDGVINVNQLNDLLQNNTQTARNPIELLVLSACETATGDKRAALGLAGVAVRAGARSTLATLWSINDRSTAYLMGQFYSELPKRHFNKAEALRQAQLVLLKNHKYQNPYYWTPYVLLGNWL